MSNYRAWVNNATTQFPVYQSYSVSQVANRFDYHTKIGDIYPGEIYYFVASYTHPGGGGFGVCHEIIFLAADGVWKRAYHNTLYLNISTLQSRLENVHRQVVTINGKKLVWARTNRTVNVYDSSGNYVRQIPVGYDIAKDVTTHDTFLCGATRRDYMTFTHWFDPSTNSWKFLLGNGAVAFVDIIDTPGNFFINVW